MNRDLEEQLKGLGPDYRSVVDRLRAARTAEPCVRGQGRKSRSTVEWLVAATLLLVLALTVIFLTPQPLNPSTPQLLNISTSQPLNLSTSQPPFGAREYHLSPAEMIATQNPDGSWKNDFLTRRNAEALACCNTPAARIAYKKAMRNLRSRGIL